MFSFFKKFKQLSDTDGDVKGDKEKPGTSPVTPARRRDDKAKDKSITREQEVGGSSFDTKKTNLAVSAGAKRKDTEQRSGEVREQPSVQQHGKKNESVTVKAGEKKVPVQGTSTAKVMGSVTAAMTPSDDTNDIGKNRDLAKSATTHTNREASQDEEKGQHEAAEALTAVSRSRATPVDLTMVTKRQVEEQPREDNEVTQNISESVLSSSTQEKFAALEKEVEKITDMKKQVEQLENEK
jgi:hypothetical protein